MALMRVSQGQLNNLETCPRQFQHLYFDQLASPISLEQQERLKWGSQFHRMMQQREMGLPIAAMQQEPIEQCVQALLHTAPNLFQLDPTAVRQSEHYRSLEFEGYLLTVVYDLLILKDTQALILDWKTYPHPQHRRSLAHHWQTRLYPFVLAETTDYHPEQITMTYWFVQAQVDQGGLMPQNLEFAYSTAQHNEIRQDLTNWLRCLDKWRQIGEEFPQVDETKGICKFCPFAMRCQRGQEPHGTPFNELPLLADIQELAL